MATPPDPQATAPRHELAAIMFSDIAGYTAIMGRDEQAAIRALDAHRGTLRALLPQFDGRLVGEIGDGWIYAGCDLNAVREGLARINQAAHGSGRQGRVRAAVALASACVLRPGEALTSPRVLSRVGPHSAVALHPYWQPGEIPLSKFGTPKLQPLVEKYHRDYLMKMKTPLEKRFQEIHWGHLIFLKPGEDKYMTEDLIREMSLTGSAAEIIERIKALEQAGITQFVVRVNGTDGRELISEFGRDVIAKYA